VIFPVKKKSPVLRGKSPVVFVVFWRVYEDFSSQLGTCGVLRLFFVPGAVATVIDFDVPML